MPQRITSKIGEYIAHKTINNGIGILLSIDSNIAKTKFENGLISLYPLNSIAKLTSSEAIRVRISAYNIRNCNRRIKLLKASESDAHTHGDKMAATYLRTDIERSQSLAMKECDYLKNTFEITYEIEN